MNIDPALYDYCTPRQREVLEAIDKVGSGHSAAGLLGIHKSAVYRHVEAVKAKAAEQGYSPKHDMKHPVPDGFKVKGVSTYYDSEGQPRGQWVKSSADQERRDAMLRAAVEGMAGEITPALPVVMPAITFADLLTLYTFTDFHLGALCWHKEGGNRS